MIKSVWITWEDHRRSRELAREFGAKYILIKSPSNRLFKYIYASMATLLNLVVYRPKNVFCQNPSVMLAFTVVFLRKIFGFKAIVDRHSNFKIDKLAETSIKWRLFHFVSNYSLKNADITIVTNDRAKQYLRKYSNEVVILPDVIPKFDYERHCNDFRSENTLEKTVLFVTTFDDDEPIEPMISAAGKLESVRCYFTGNYLKRFSRKEALSLEAKGIYFTGFVPNEEYERLLFISDVVVVLTDKDLILNCGAYEAIGAEKPVVLSNTRTLVSYFGNSGVTYVTNDSDGIFEGIKRALDNADTLKAEINLTKRELNLDWLNKKNAVLNLIRQ